VLEGESVGRERRHRSAGMPRDVGSRCGDLPRAGVDTGHAIVVGEHHEGPLGASHVKAHLGGIALDERVAIQTRALFGDRRAA
jgi:hypothetical protein